MNEPIEQETFWGDYMALALEGAATWMRQQNHTVVIQDVLVRLLTHEVTIYFVRRGRA